MPLFQVQEQLQEGMRADDSSYIGLASDLSNEYMVHFSMLITIISLFHSHSERGLWSEIKQETCFFC